MVRTRRTLTPLMRLSSLAGAAILAVALLAVNAPPASAEFNARTCAATPPTKSWRGAQLPYGQSGNGSADGVSAVFPAIGSLEPYYLQICLDLFGGDDHSFSAAYVALTNESGGSNEIVQIGYVRLGYANAHGDDIQLFYAAGGPGTPPYIQSLGLPTSGTHKLEIKRLQILPGFWVIRFYDNDVLKVSLTQTGYLSWVGNASTIARVEAETDDPADNMGGDGSHWFTVNSIKYMLTPGGAWAGVNLQGGCIDYGSPSYYNCQYASTSAVRWSTDSP